jgi:hypothetical protein
LIVDKLYCKMCLLKVQWGVGGSTGPCNRRASHIKSAIKRYINEGHDVTSAEEMKLVIIFLSVDFCRSYDSLNLGIWWNFYKCNKVLPGISKQAFFTQINILETIQELTLQCFETYPVKILF